MITWAEIQPCKVWSQNTVNVTILQMLWSLLEDYEETCSNACVKLILHVTTNLNQDIVLTHQILADKKALCDKYGQNIYYLIIFQ